MINLCFNNYFSRDIDFLWQKPFSLLPNPCLPFPEQGSAPPPTPPGTAPQQKHGWGWRNRAAAAGKGAGGRGASSRLSCRRAAAQPDGRGRTVPGSFSAPQTPLQALLGFSGTVDGGEGGVASPDVAEVPQRDAGNLRGCSETPPF